MAQSAIQKALTYTDAEIEEMAYGLLGEAESGGVIGMMGVANVVRNRADNPVFSSTGDAYEVFTHEGWFSTFNDEDAGGNQTAVRARVAKGGKSADLFEQAKIIVRSVIAAEVRPPDPTGAATFYHSTDAKAPYWASSVKTSYGTVTDGSHLFYANAPQEIDFNSAATAIDANFSAPVPISRPTNPIKQVSGVEINRVIQSQINAPGKARNDPLNDDLTAILAYAATKNGVYVDVYSGGQTDKRVTREGTDWTGSHRHDLGRAADVDLYVLNADGTKRVLNWTNAADQKIWAAFVADAVAAGATGVGAALDYMGPTRAHIGFGGTAVWGKGRYKNANGEWVVGPPADWIVDAQATGLNMPKPDLGYPSFAYYENPKGVPQGREATYWGIDPVEDALSVTPILEWNETSPEESVVTITAPDVDAYYDPDRGAFFLNEIEDTGSLENIDQTALGYAMAAANVGGQPTDVASLYAGILPIRSEIVLSAGGARPEGPAAGMPGAKYQPMVVGRPEAPIGQMPAAQPKVVVAGRPDAPVGSLPAAAAPGMDVTPVLPANYDKPGAYTPAELKRIAATKVPMDQSAVQARATILDEGFGSLLGAGPLPATPNPRPATPTTPTTPTGVNISEYMRNAIAATPKQRIEDAVAANRSGTVSSTAKDVEIRTATVRGEPVQTTATGKQITVSQQLAMQSITKTIQSTVKVPINSSGSPDDRSKPLATPKNSSGSPDDRSSTPPSIIRTAGTTTVHKDGTTTVQRPAGTVQMPATVKPQIITTKPVTITKTVTETKQVPVVSYVRPEGPVGSMPAAKPVVKLAPPTQTIDPAMRNAISAVPAELLKVPAITPPPVVQPLPAPKKVVTYKTVTIKKKVTVVVPGKTTKQYDEGSGKVVTVRQAMTPTGPTTIKGSATGNTYVVGQTYQAGGYQYVATADGFVQVKGSGSGGNKNNSNPGVNKMGVKIGSGGVFGGSDVGSGVASSTNPGGI